MIDTKSVTRWVNPVPDLPDPERLEHACRGLALVNTGTPVLDSVVEVAAEVAELHRDRAMGFDRRTGVFTRLKNRPAQSMAQLMFAGTDDTALIAEIAQRFDVDQARVAADAAELAASLTAPAPPAAAGTGASLLEIDKRFDAKLDFPLRL